MRERSEKTSSGSCLFREECLRVTTTLIALVVMRLDQRFVQRPAGVKALLFAPSVARAAQRFDHPPVALPSEHD